MKSELLKTALFAAVALALVVAANWVEPEAARPDVFSDQGEPLFPKFRDVMAVKAIEVVGYDEQEASARPLKVEFRKGQWILPSHNDYPAEAGERLSKTAAALLDLRKDLVVSDRIEDHVRYGVVDPLDMNATSLTGRGKRVVLRDTQGEVLAQVVFGKPDEGHPGYRYARLPDQKRVYSIQTTADPSSNFEDWVEGNLLRISAADVRRITINSYSIDESMGRIANAERIVMTREGNNWTSEGTRKPSQADIQALVTSLGRLRVVGARPKPKPLADQLRSGEGLAMTLDVVMSLRQRGFFITPDGRLLANEGEVSVETAQGLLYTLRFGEVVSGTIAGKEGESAKGSSGDQDRFLFITVTYSPDRAAKYGPAAEGGERTARTLSNRFADWYYIVPGGDFAKLRLKRS